MRIGRHPSFSSASEWEYLQAQCRSEKSGLAQQYGQCWSSGAIQTGKQGMEDIKVKHVSPGIFIIKFPNPWLLACPSPSTSTRLVGISEHYPHHFFDPVVAHLSAPADKTTNPIERIASGIISSTIFRLPCHFQGEFHLLWRVSEEGVIVYTCFLFFSWLVGWVCVGEGEAIVLVAGHKLWPELSYNQVFFTDFYYSSSGH